MRNKKYRVKVKMIKETEIIVSDKNMQRAILKVASLLNDCITNNVDLSKTFNDNPDFTYKVEKI